MAGRESPSAPSIDSNRNSHSRITAISVSGSQDLGTFGGAAYRRTWGAVSGLIDPAENVHGFETLPHDAAGNFYYSSDFEIMAPAKLNTNSVIVVEAENRGSPVFLNSLHGIAATGPPSSATYAAGLGNAFLFEHATSYARVDWQTGIAASVPPQAEGVGEVIVRDFARLLGGRTEFTATEQFDPGKYQSVILSGISLSGFFINTFIAE